MPNANTFDIIVDDLLDFCGVDWQHVAIWPHAFSVQSTSLVVDFDFFEDLERALSVQNFKVAINHAVYDVKTSFRGGQELVFQFDRLEVEKDG